MTETRLSPGLKKVEIAKKKKRIFRSTEAVVLGVIFCSVFEWMNSSATPSNCRDCARGSLPMEPLEGVPGIYVEQKLSHRP